MSRQQTRNERPGAHRENIYEREGPDDKTGRKKAKARRDGWISHTLASINGPIHIYSVTFRMQEPRIVRLDEKDLSVVPVEVANRDFSDQSFRVGGLHRRIRTKGKHNGGIHFARDHDPQDIRDTNQQSHYSQTEGRGVPESSDHFFCATTTQLSPGSGRMRSTILPIGSNNEKTLVCHDRMLIRPLHLLNNHPSTPNLLNAKSSVT